MTTAGSIIVNPEKVARLGERLDATVRPPLTEALDAVTTLRPYAPDMPPALAAVLAKAATSVHTNLALRLEGLTLIHDALAATARMWTEAETGTYE